MIHEEMHPLAGKTVILNDKANDNVRGIVVEGAEFCVEDWWDRGYGNSWMWAQGNPAAMHYGMRSGTADLPIDDEVVYGKIGAFGHLVHVTELGDVKCDHEHTRPFSKSDQRPYCVSCLETVQ